MDGDTLYQYRGPKVADISAEAVNEELGRINSERGQLIPPDIVEESREPDATLHDAFEWHDPTAAAEHRLYQARQIVRAVHVVAQPERGETFAPQRAFHSVIAKGQGRTYRPVREVQSNPDEKQQVLSRMRNELANLRQRYLDTASFLEAPELEEAVSQFESIGKGMIEEAAVTPT